MRFTVISLVFFFILCALQQEIEIICRFLLRRSSDEASQVTLASTSHFAVEDVTSTLCVVLVPVESLDVRNGSPHRHLFLLELLVVVLR